MSGEMRSGLQFNAEAIAQVEAGVLKQEVEEREREEREGRSLNETIDILKNELSRVNGENAVLREQLEARKKPKLSHKEYLINHQRVRNLRKTDPADKKTCSVCERRRPKSDMEYGNADICEDCK